jgi:hypothetical protein
MKEFFQFSKVHHELASLLASRRGTTYGTGQPKEATSCEVKSAPQPRKIVRKQRFEDGPGNASEVRCPLARHSLSAQSRSCAT